MLYIYIDYFIWIDHSISINLFSICLHIYRFLYMYRSFFPSLSTFLYLSVFYMSSPLSIIIYLCIDHSFLSLSIYLLTTSDCISTWATHYLLLYIYRSLPICAYKNYVCISFCNWFSACFARHHRRRRCLCSRHRLASGQMVFKLNWHLFWTLFAVCAYGGLN